MGASDIATEYFPSNDKKNESTADAITRTYSSVNKALMVNVEFYPYLQSKHMVKQKVFHSVCLTLWVTSQSKESITLNGLSIHLSIGMNFDTVNIGPNCPMENFSAIPCIVKAHYFVSKDGSTISNVDPIYFFFS